MVVIEKRLQEDIQQRFGVKNFRYLASGDDSDTFLCDDTYIVKVPKHETARKNQVREFQLYSYLSKQSLSFQTPRTICQGYHYNIMSYIEGHTLTYEKYQTLSEKEKDALAYDEAVFLKELHSVQVDCNEPFYKDSVQNKKEQFESDQRTLLSILKKEGWLTHQRQDAIDGFYANILEKKFLFDYVPCLIHNDFSSDNMVFRNNRLYGVIDFGDFAIGDPDNDFLCILDCSTDDFGKEFGRRVLSFYGHKTPELAERKAEINDAYWPIQQILLGNDRNDRRLMLSGYRCLEQQQWRI